MVLVLSDGVPGHDRSSAGVLAALRRRGPISPAWLAIAENRPRSRRLARIAAALREPHRFLRRATRLAASPRPATDGEAILDWPPRADVVVSTGPSTAAANIAAARRYGARNIYCGFPKAPVMGFTLILSPVPSRSRHVALAPRPTEIDAQTLAAPSPLDDAAPRTVAVLLGGDSKHYRYESRDLALLGKHLATILSERPLWRAVVFDSRRTPSEPFAAMEDELRAVAGASVHRFAEAGIGSNRAAFEADLAIVTADSLSMITEAIAARRPTLVLAPRAYRPPRRDRQELDRLEREGLIVRTTIEDLTAADLLRAPPTEAPSAVDSLAALLGERGF